MTKYNFKVIRKKYSQKIYLSKKIKLFPQFLKHKPPYCTYLKKKITSQVKNVLKTLVFNTTLILEFVNPLLPKKKHFYCVQKVNQINLMSGPNQGQGNYREPIFQSCPNDRDTSLCNTQLFDCTTLFWKSFLCMVMSCACFGPRHPRL